MTWRRRTTLACGLLLAGLALVLGLGAREPDPRTGIALAGKRGHGISLDAEMVAGARALREALAAIEEGDLERAADQLTLAERCAPLADYVALHRARMVLVRGQPVEASEAALAGRLAHASSPIRAEFDRLAGDALAAAGQEEAARASWEAALSGIEDGESRQEVKLAIVRSKQRTGEITQVGGEERLAAALYPELSKPSELPAGERTARQALEAGDELKSKGLGEQAIAAFEEALAGGLEPDDWAHATFQRGHALFGLRRYREASGAFKQLGDDPRARFWFARSRARAGDVSRAIALFEALGEDGPPEYASRSLYLAAILLEDRGESERAMAHFERVASYEQFPERAAEALWRAGWWSYRHGDYAQARVLMAKVESRMVEPIDKLRPRYWRARAAEETGERKLARREFASLVAEFPLSYYGWRAMQRLGLEQLGWARDKGPEVGRLTIDRPALVRVALLVEAGLDDGARAELEPLARRARTMTDRVRLGRLYVEAGDYYGAQRLVVRAFSNPLSRGVQPGREELWWLSWPPAYRSIVEAEAARRPHVSPGLVWAIMREESSFRPEVTSSAGAMGLLQLMPETAARTALRSGQGELQVEALHTAETNIALGAAYLDHLQSRFPGRISAAIASYNAGPVAVKRWLAGDAAELEDDVWVEEIPYAQTRSYTRRVLRSLHVYQRFY